MSEPSDPQLPQAKPLAPQLTQATTPDCVESGLEPVNNAAILPGLIAQTRDPDPSVVVAARVLARAGPAAAAAIPALVERVPSEYCWAWALEALLRIGPASIPALEAAAGRADAPCEADDVLWLLKNPDARQALDVAEPPQEDGHRFAAGNWYLLRGRQDNLCGACVVTELLKLSAGGDDELRTGARKVLLKAFEGLAEAFEVLVARRGIFDEDTPMEDRLAAIRFLGELGPRAAPVVPALEEVLSDPELGPAAGEALARIRPDDAGN